MSNYKIVIGKSAEKELIRLPIEAIVRIQEKVGLLADDPRPTAAKS